MKKLILAAILAIGSLSAHADDHWVTQPTAVWGSVNQQVYVQPGTVALEESPGSTGFRLICTVWYYHDETFDVADSWTIGYLTSNGDGTYETPGGYDEGTPNDPITFSKAYVEIAIYHPRNGNWFGDQAYTIMETTLAGSDQPPPIYPHP